MTIKEYKDKHSDIVFIAQEFLELEEIKQLVHRIVDLEKIVENLQNQLN